MNANWLGFVALVAGVLLCPEVSAYSSLKIEQISGNVCEPIYGRDAHAIDRNIYGIYNGASVHPEQYSTDWGLDYVPVVCPLDDVKASGPMMVYVHANISDRVSTHRFLTCHVYALSSYDGRILASDAKSVSGTGDKVVALRMDYRYGANRVVHCTLNKRTTIRSLSVYYQ